MRSRNPVFGPVRAGDRREHEKGPRDEPERLICMKDNVEIPAGDPRCLYTTSRCRVREWCPVTEAIRARKGKARV